MLIDGHDDAGSRLIVALDVHSRDEALRLVDELEGLVSFYKIGLQLFVAEGMQFARELIQERKKRVFLDLKIDDVEETISRTVREITKYDVRLLTLHGTGATARAAVEGRGGFSYPKLLQVTLLSSLDEGDLRDLGILGENKKFTTLLQYVLWRADQSIEAGCDGFIASGDTISAVRERVGDSRIIVSPGIRSSGALTDDHKRPATPAAAVRAGADYLVVGRPIRNASDRRGATEGIIEEISGALGAYR
jgi:orotidine-5'-phosphate decarboxylase